MAENTSRQPRITGKSFRLNKTAKRALALRSFTSPDQRAAFRRMMIEAQVAASSIRPKDRTDRSTQRGAPSE